MYPCNYQHIIIIMKNNRLLTLQPFLICLPWLITVKCGTQLGNFNSKDFIFTDKMKMRVLLYSDAFIEMN